MNKLTKKLVKFRKRLIKRFFKNPKNKYLEINLVGGLCNKIHCLISACDIALKDGAYIIEPDFGWREKIKFSDIYDIDHFNKVLSNYNNGNKIMINKDKFKNKFFAFFNIRIIDNDIDLWDYSEKALALERKSGKISKKSTKLIVLEALKLKPELEDLVTEYLSNNIELAVQIRTESDWKNYAKLKKLSDPNESIFVNFSKIISMISNIGEFKNIFFTSGENHKEIRDHLKQLNYKSHWFFNSNFEYEINAAINFELCSRAKYFIGNSRSSFSNLISLKRAYLLETDNSYIYNYGNKLHRRLDKGLQPSAYESINKETTFY